MLNTAVFFVVRLWIAYVSATLSLVRRIEMLVQSTAVAQKGHANADPFTSRTAHASLFTASKLLRRPVVQKEGLLFVAAWSGIVR